MAVPIKERFHNIIKAAQGKESRLSSVEIMTTVYNGPEDEILDNKGADGYWEMFRDPKVSSGVEGAITLMIPDVPQSEPYDTSDKAVRNAEFVDAILAAIPGSTLDVFRQMLREAVVTGPSISEPDFQIMTLPEFGSVKGIHSLNVKPTQSFIEAVNGIDVDRFGNIKQFNQGASYGGNSALPSEVIYWALNGSPNNRWGRSMLNSVYDPWKYKQKILRIAGLFFATNASGLRIAHLPNAGDDKATKKQLQDAQGTMRKIASLQSMAVLKDWEVEVQKPGSGTGGHFIEFIQEMDRQILEGIYGDSAYSAQDQGSYASRLASQSNVQARMRAIGNAFMEAISEQLVPWILRENGFDGPAPKIVAGIPEDASSKMERYKVIGDLKQKQVITVEIPDVDQREMLRTLGVEVDESAVTTEPQQVEPEPVTASESIIHAKAPTGRSKTDINKNDKELVKAIDTGAEDLSETWQNIVPDIMKKLSGQVFNPGLNGWKVTDLSKLYEISRDTAKYKSSNMRKSLNAALKSGYELGNKHAERMVPVKALEAAAGFTPAAVLKSLDINARILLEEKYGEIGSAIYRMLQNAVGGTKSSAEIYKEIEEMLRFGSAFRPGLATTIINTSLASAYNEARMSLFAKVTDPTGRKPGSIIGYVFAAIIDSRTTDICQSLDGKAFAADDSSLPQPPLHYNCRSQLIPVMSGEKPWTSESGGEFLSDNESSKLIADAKAMGEIQQGFGGV
jgi:SPP1 gp7 family putative phage head morphogenesis protein